MGGFPRALDRQTKPSDWLELVSGVKGAYPGWQKSLGPLKAYLTEELISAGRVKVLSRAHGLYQVLRRRIV